MNIGGLGRLALLGRCVNFATSKTKLRTFKEAKQFLYSYIPRQKEHRFPGELGLRRARELLELLGNPQEKMKVIHVAGTSGKGSTAYLTSLLLQSLGFKTGFHVSPHLLDIRERCQINNRLISKGKFVGYLTEIVPAIKGMQDITSRARYKRVTYFEILVALAFYIFRREGVDYGVVETGLGGMYDATNTVKRKDKLCLLTRVGKDHTRILGKTLPEIARQKAAIIQEGNTVIALRQREVVNEIFRQTAVAKKARLKYIQKNKNFSVFNTRVHKSEKWSIRTDFNFQFEDCEFRSLELGLLGRHQVENASLALAAVAVLGERDKFSLRQPRGGESEKKMRKVLAKASFPGRLEVFRRNEKMVIVDGAHNPQKMRALTESLREIFPGAKFDFVVGFKKGKESTDMLKYIVKLAGSIIITSFVLEGQDFSVVSQEPEELGKALRRLQYANYTVVKDPVKAIRAGLEDSQKKILVVTGSLYLISKIYPEIKRAL